MSVHSRINVFNDGHIDIMAQGMKIAADRLTEEGRTEDVEVVQARLARTMMALINEGYDTPGALAEAALSRLQTAILDEG